MLIAQQYFMKISMAHAGSSTTKEAGKTAIIVGRIMNNLNSDCADFDRFLSQIRIQNLHLQNVFFKINWNVLLAVSRKIIFVGNLYFSSYFHTDNLIHGHISGHNMSI